MHGCPLRTVLQPVHVQYSLAGEPLRHTVHAALEAGLHTAESTCFGPESVLDELGM